MMIRNKTTIEVEVNGRLFRFECCMEAMLEEAAKALEAMSRYIQSRLDADKIKPATPES